MVFIVKVINGQKTLVPVTADVGSGCPLGSIIVTLQTIAPSGYVALGTQFDRTAYPALYALLGTDTTPTSASLGLPTLLSGQYVIKATSGVSENQQETLVNVLNAERSYSTSEINTGKTWIDGKPIYRKVSQSTNALSLNSEQYQDSGASMPLNFETMIKTEGITPLRNFFYYNYTHNTLYIAGIQPIQINSGVNFIFEYTKTTD